MKIQDFDGEVEVHDLDTLQDTLARCFRKNANEIWLSMDKKYPSLGILIQDKLACVHFFPKEGHPGFRSIGEQLLNLNGVSIFHVNTPQEEIEVTNKAVIDLSTALQASQEFFQTGQMPQCVKWLEL